MSSLLESVADFQIERSREIIVVSIVFTALLASGIPEIQLQTDFQDSLPDDIDAVKAQEKVEKNFGSSDSIIILFQVNDKPRQESYVNDIRDERIVQTLNFLENELEKEPVIDSTSSMASLFDENPNNKQEVIEKLENSDASFTNRDYTATTMFVKLSEEMTEENIEEATEVVKQNIEESPKYPGVDIAVTGTPVVRTEISRVLSRLPVPDALA